MNDTHDVKNSFQWNENMSYWKPSMTSWHNDNFMIVC